MTRSRLNDQARLKVVCDAVCDNIEQLLDLFGIEYKTSQKMITMSCPIHGGDNVAALNLYPDGENYRGNWVCRTHGCEKVFKGSVLGFIRGVISHQKYGWTCDKDTQCSFKEALNFALEFTKQDLKSIKISRSQIEKKNFTNIVNYISTSESPKAQGIGRDSVRRSLSIPAQYYLDRNYSADILNKYDVGLCTNPSKEMFNRVVVPVYNNDHTIMVGCSGRSIYDKCASCGSFHDVSKSCPEEDRLWMYSKWKHNAGFKSQNHLYNLWYAKDHILSTNTVILVESPGNVWRLEENGIHNSVAVFGASLSDRQKFYLDSSGAMNLVILMDNDEAGKQAAQKIKEKCQQAYRVYIPEISKPDVGEMTSEEVNIEIKNFLENIK